MDLIITRYFATGIQGRERAILGKREPSSVGNQGLVFLTVWGDSSLVIDKLCDEAVEEDTAVVCFYFDFASRSEQSPINMLGSLLRQLVGGLEGIPEVVVRSFRNQKKVIGGRGLQVSGILKMFQTITATKRTFICVDALDECAPEHRIVILESLGQIVRESVDTRIFVTGRSHIRSEVERKWGGAAAFVLIEPTGDGIVEYLREKLRSDTTPEMMNSGLEENILESISQLSSETYVETIQGQSDSKLPQSNMLTSEPRFLLACLHIEAILRETSIARRGKRLKAVKDGAGLGDAYGATLERIKAQGGEKTKLAIATLMWIYHAERPLQVDELRHALAVEIGVANFDSENAPSIGALLGCCQGLITVDKEASTVRLIHFTVQEYLCAHKDLFSHPHSVIAEACLTYLNSPQVKDLPSHPLSDPQVMPFLQYSSRYWGIHAKREFSGNARTLALELLDRYEDHVSGESLLCQVLHPTCVAFIGASLHLSGLHCASLFGIVELVASLMNAPGCQINQGDCTGYTPLLWAAKNGHDGVVKVLLEWDDVSPDRPNNQGSTPLSWAADNGHEEVVKLLLGRNDVDPNHADEHGATPLEYAAIAGHDGVVKLLLGREDVEPNRPDNERRTPLYCAANGGHEGVVKLLLDQKDVDPNHSHKGNYTPLRAAAVQGHEGVVKLLLGREDVDPNRSGLDGRTPLACAAAKGHEEVFKLLLDRDGVDPNRPGVDGLTPLGLAAFWGQKGTAKLLLARDDVDPNCPDISDQTPLWWAASKGFEGVVDLLLGREDVNPNLPQGGQTPLACAAMNGHQEVVQLLQARISMESAVRYPPDQQ